MSAEQSAEPKPPARAAAEIRADIERERDALAKSFESLRGDLDAAVDAGRQRVADAGRKARTVGPVAAGLVAFAAVVRLLFRRRRRATR